jgi:DNA-binding transcriptional ArsR family regulator
VLTITLTAADLRKIIIVSAEHPETVGALVTARATTGSTFLESWRDKAQAALPHRRSPLLRVIPARGIVPDEVAPEGLSAGTTPSVVAAMRQRLAAGSAQSAAASAHTRAIWSTVGGGLLRFHHEAMIPARPSLRRVLTHELTASSAALMSGGVDAALSRLGGSIRWQPPHLVIDSPHQGLIQGTGQGLRLVPSVFWRRPAVAIDGFRIPTVTYPVDADRIDRWAVSPETSTAALLGSTRTAILELLFVGRTTTDVARELSLGLATVSVHLATLHHNGLITSSRTGRSIRHLITPLGRRVLAPFD